MGSAKPQRGDQDKCEIPQSLWHLVNVVLQPEWLGCLCGYGVPMGFLGEDPDKIEMGSAKPQSGDQDKCEIP